MADVNMTGTFALSTAFTEQTLWHSLCYTTVEYADAFMSTRLNTTIWDATSNDDKFKALTHATQQVDNLNYAGELNDEDQPLQFPRYDDATIPEDIQRATVLLANGLLCGIDPDREYENLMMSSQSYGNVKSNYDRTVVQLNVVAGIPIREAWAYLVPYLRDIAEIQLDRV